MFLVINANHQIWGFNEFYLSEQDAQKELQHFWGSMLSKLKFKVWGFDDYLQTLDEPQKEIIMKRKFKIIYHI